MRIRVCLMVLLALMASSGRAFAQNWSFDARNIALGGVGGTGNLATKMIDDERKYWSLVLPFGLVQIFNNTKIYDPNDKAFDPVQALQNVASPLHYIVNRNTTNSGEALFVNDVRNATLTGKLSRYKGFVPANNLLVEGLITAPTIGHTIKVHKDANGGFQGIFIGVSPYLSVHDEATFDSGLTGVLSSGIDVANATFPIKNADQGQVALAVVGGYRGRFSWPMGVGSGSDREGLYVAANYNYLRGLEYEKDDMTVLLKTNASGSVDATSNISLKHQHATSGTGMAIDMGVGAVIKQWEVGFGAKGLGNRVNWSGVEQTTYTLASVTSGNSDFLHTTTVAAADTRVELPVDYRGNLAYVTDRWSAAGEAGHGFGGTSFHGGFEVRAGRLELRAGARYTVKKWNPTGGIGLNLSRRVSLDVAAFGTNTNIELKRQMAIAASLRFNHLK
jgi:hypothetical protein